METLVTKVSDYLKDELKLKDDDAEIVNYGLAVFISGISGIVAILIVAWLLGVVKLALAAAFTAAGLRVLSGGAHSESIRNCSLLGALVSPGIAVFVKYYAIYFSAPVLIPVVTGVWFFGLWAVLRYAPADTPHKPITDGNMKKRLRRLSLAYLVLWLALAGVSMSGLYTILSPDLILASTLGLMWQAFSLTPWGYKLVAELDALLP